jgi:glycerol-3-phosphate dehydrogenase
MALDLVERVAWDLSLALPPSTSHTTPLLGAGERPLLPGLPCLEGEVVWAVRQELAAKPMDVLARRLGLALLDREKALSALPRWWRS